MTIRRSLKYREWRKSCFERDNYTCQDCGKKGGYLEVHHVKSFSDFPKLRFIINNGITYCKICHCKNDKKRNKFNKTPLPTKTKKTSRGRFWNPLKTFYRKNNS